MWQKKAKVITIHVDQKGARISRIELIRELRDRFFNKSFLKHFNLFFCQVMKPLLQFCSLIGSYFTVRRMHFVHAFLCWYKQQIILKTFYWEEYGRVI